MALSFAQWPRLADRRFLFGTATAAYQIEGATSVDGRLESIWDRFSRQPGAVANGDSGEPACDHYRRWESDLAIVKSLGLDAYRFSIAWPRVVDEHGNVNGKGLAFYDRLVDWLLAHNLKPYLTLYHWDLPQYLQDRGGWAARETAEAYWRYVEIVARHFGNRVVSYATFNEPWCSAFLGYGHGIHAPGVRDYRAAYHAAHHLLLAHGGALPILQTYAAQAEHGIVLNGAPRDPLIDEPGHQLAATLAYSELVKLFLDPILHGQYPAELLQHRGHLLPRGFERDLNSIRGDIAYLGLNYYTRNRIRPASNEQGFEVLSPAQGKPTTAMGWGIHPEGLGMWLRQLQHDYQRLLPPLYITENGAAFDDVLIDGSVHDTKRLDYFASHLASLHEAMAAGVDVRGYFIWSLLDNFEWAEGYRKRFGIVYVDYDSQQRYLKDSAKAFQAALLARKKP